MVLFFDFFLCFVFWFLVGGTEDGRRTDLKIETGIIK